jgi:hypothetical protein
VCGYVACAQRHSIREAHNPDQRPSGATWQEQASCTDKPARSSWFAGHIKPCVAFCATGQHQQQYRWGASPSRLGSQRWRFRLPVTVAHDATPVSPRTVVSDASTRVVTGGVLPVTTRCKGLKPWRQAAFFRVIVVSDGAKCPTSPASLAKFFARSGGLVVVTRARGALHGPWVIGPCCGSSLRERAVVPDAHAARAGSNSNRIHGGGAPRPVKQRRQCFAHIGRLCNAQTRRAVSKRQMLPFRNTKIT